MAKTVAHGAEEAVTPEAAKARALTVVDWIAMILVIIGGVNWGLFGLASIDLVATIFGSLTVISRIVYVVVGLSALYLLADLPRLSRK